MNVDSKKYWAAKSAKKDRRPVVPQPPRARRVDHLKRYEKTVRDNEQRQTEREEAKRAADAPIQEQIGSMYFLLCDNPHDPIPRVKIGWSKEPKVRQQQLSTGSAYPLKLLATVPNVSLLEDKHWRARFKQYQCEDAAGNEWFRLEGELKLFLETWTR